jgi:fatty-acyl-CoA synthase
MGRAATLIIQLKQGQSATRGNLKCMDGKIAKWWMPDDVAFVEAFRTRPARS